MRLNSPSARGSPSGHQEIQTEPSFPKRDLGLCRGGVVILDGRGGWISHGALAGDLSKTWPRVC